jgi:hypothetical protein
MAAKTKSKKTSKSVASKKSRSRRIAGKKKSASAKGQKKPSGRKWSGKVTATSDAMDLEQNIFKSNSAKKIASSVKKSAEKSKRRKGTPLQSAMGMLNFYENRAGKNLSGKKRETIDHAKQELRKMFGKK